MNAYLFDVDGVLNNPKMGLAVGPEVIALLTSFLQRGEPVGLISGRSLKWQVADVVKPMEKYIDENEATTPEIIDNLFVSGEFGIASIIHENTKRKILIDKVLEVPALFEPALEEASKEFMHKVFREIDKEHTFTLVSNHDLTREEFLKVRSEIADKFRKIVADNPDIEVHEDRTAVNVRNKRANKRTATEHFLTWLAEKHVNPGKFYVFGDSISDLEMGTELHSRNLPFEFIFVGDHEDMHDRVLNFPVTLTNHHAVKGTLEYFKQLQ